MQRGTKEFHDLQQAFEKDANKLAYGLDVTSRVTEEEAKRLPAGIFYNHGQTNQFFKMFMFGYSFSKIYNA